MAKPINAAALLAAEAEKLKHLLKGWDGKPRLDPEYQLPWPKYTRHNWPLLYTHFLYYTFDNVRQFAEVYGLNYKSSQLWIQIGKVSRDWTGNKRRWLMDVIQFGNRVVIKALRDPDKYVDPYRPFSLPGRETKGNKM